MTRPESWMPSAQSPGTTSWSRSGLPFVVAVLFLLGAANVVTRATYRPVDDGAFWRPGAGALVARAIAPESAAERAGIRPGDVLLFVDERPVDSADALGQTLRQVSKGQTVRYTVLRPGIAEPLELRIEPQHGGAEPLYYVLAAVGLFTLLIGAGVRMRRPQDEATLHFFWLAVAFFGVLTFSFSGRLDRLDWVFYWADIVATLALPPLFLHFTAVFPERPRGWTASDSGRALLAAAYAPALLLGAAHVMAFARRTADPALFERVLLALDRIENLYLGACLIAGMVGLARTRRMACTITARRQLRWIAWGTALGGVPFAVGYALPHALGWDVPPLLGLVAIPLSLLPLTYASAIVRYRLLDIEVIVKRSVIYAAALGAVALIYLALLQGADYIARPGGATNSWLIAVLATLVALLLAPPVKSAVQTLFDRAFYRDRYDYRRALVGFARDLNSDLDLNRLAERLVSRVVETLVVDRMALMVESDAGTHFASVHASGFGGGTPPALALRSAVGARLVSGHLVALDDPIAVGRFTVEEIEFWRDAGLYYFVPCVSKEKTIAVLALGRPDTGAHLNSEDMHLLRAVAGQVATALENARLYQQLHAKAVELDRLRSFNENILESLDSGLLVLDLNDRIVRWNHALELLYGVSRSEAHGRRFSELFDASFVDAVLGARRDTPSGATLSRVPLRPRPGGAGRPVMVNVAVVPLRASADLSGTTIGTIVIAADVTARVQLEEQLQISEKMASIGLLAAGVAHEVNTPLTGISSFTQLLLEGADPEDPRTRLLEKIERQTFRAAKIVNGLLNLSRPAAQAATARSPVDLNVVISDVLGLLEHQLELHRIKVRRELSAEPPVVSGLEHKLQQVFLNLFLNAKDAMPKGGWLSVSTRVENGKVVAEVADTGSGIPTEYLSRIYDPFFTTKVLGEGTGLGLSITYGIVREHDGSIECESAVGQGTRFTIALPQAAAERPVLAAHAQAGSVIHAPERVNTRHR